MPCGFCSNTTLSPPCPVCTVAPTPDLVIRKARRTTTTSARTVKASGKASDTLTCSRCGEAKPRNASGAYSRGAFTCNACWNKPAPKSTPTPIVAPTPVQTAPMGPLTFGATCEAGECARLWSERNFMEAARILNSLSRDSSYDNVRVMRRNVLMLIATNTELRGGKMSGPDAALFTKIGKAVVEECVARLGFDPRYPRPTSTPAPEIEAPRPVLSPSACRPLAPFPKAAPPPAPVKAETLTAGDYEDLNRRLAAGEINKAQAEEIAAIWGKRAAQTDSVLESLLSRRS